MSRYVDDAEWCGGPINPDDRFPMKYTIETTKGGPDVAFSGRQVAQVDSRGAGNDRWSQLTLYLTDAGAYVCQRQGFDAGSGDELYCEAIVGQTGAELVEKLGHGWLSKELYDAAEIAHVRVIE